MSAGLGIRSLWRWRTVDRQSVDLFENKYEALTEFANNCGLFVWDASDLAFSSSLGPEICRGEVVHLDDAGEVLRIVLGTNDDGTLILSPEPLAWAVPSGWGPAYGGLS